MLITHRKKKHLLNSTGEAQKFQREHLAFMSPWNSFALATSARPVRVWGG